MRKSNASSAALKCGAEGSVADVSLGVPERDQRMNGLLVVLVRAFALEGITDERADRWASIFETWRQAGVFQQKPQ